MDPELLVYTDGGARGNPGPAAIGVVLCDRSDHILAEHRECFGVGTNNDAEYRALIKGLALAAERTRGAIACVLDSELVVRQMRGTYRVREPRLEVLHRQARISAARFASVTYEHWPRLRGHLARADALVNEALDEAAKDYKSDGMEWPHRDARPETKR